MASTTETVETTLFNTSSHSEIVTQSVAMTSKDTAPIRST